MKLNNLVKGLIILAIVLAIGLITTTAKLLSSNNITENHNNANANLPLEDKLKEDIVEPVKEEENIKEKEPPKEEVPVKGEPQENEVKKPNNNNTDKDIGIKKDKELDNDKEQVKDKDKDKDKGKDKGKDKAKDKIKDKEKKDKEKENKKKEKEDKKKEKENEKDKAKNEKIVKSKYISVDEAIEIGLKKVGLGAKLIEIKSNLDDNPPKYELEIETENYEYELEVHAITGAVIDFEKDDK